LNPELLLDKRKIGVNQKPLVIAEIGINHEGKIEKAKQMVLDAFNAGAECIKFQSHIIEDEMIPNDVVPGNSKETIWDIMKRCSLTENEESFLKKMVEKLGMIYLSTPFSRASADRLEKMNVTAYKIGSGECNNYPLIEHIASFGKPIILSTGMNDIESITKSVKILRECNTPFALLHVTSMYPTPYENVNLGAMTQLAETFSDAVIGLSDHSLGNYTCYAATALGASILEKHFTSDKFWSGPDIPISIEPSELKELILGVNSIHLSLGGHKKILPEEQQTIDFAYSCVVSIKDIQVGEVLSEKNIWVKRPGTGQILAKDFQKVLNYKATIEIPKNTQIEWNMIEK
tara:strand:+ start:1557 stop:2594 length:1038 start_codon:yes stop_codon:yes gene_type:complete